MKQEEALREFYSEKLLLLRRIRDEYWTLYARSLSEEMHDPRLERVSGQYAESVESLDLQIKDTAFLLQKLERNQEFVKRFGSELYDLYKQKYPINVETQIVDVDTDAPFYVYPLYSPIPLSVEPSWPPILEIVTRQCYFEHWADKRYTRHLWLAFAPEINTVFVNKNRTNL